MNVKKLVWDSDFFGLRIGRVDIGSEGDGAVLVSQASLLKENFDLMYVYAHHGLAFPATNAKLVDKKTVYSLTDFPRFEENNNIVVWDRKQGITADLIHLALVSGRFSRFRLDDRFSVGSYERLYTRWIEQSINRIMATEVFCYMVGEAPQGLVTLNRKADVGTIGLVAINESFQHRGIGSSMLKHVIRYAGERQCSKLSVATQLENTLACKLYEKVSFFVESITDVWHWWL